MKKHYSLLDVLRVAAILLVLNSHFDPLYPIPALATGGAAGNGLFFILSGFCVKMQPTFGRHMLRRVLRLYPGVLISFGVQMLLGTKTITGVGSAFSQLVWPTAFWFVGAIILFDALLYWLEKLDFTRHLPPFLLVMAALYFVAYLLVIDKTRWSVEEPGLTTPGQCFKLIYCFCIYALGYSLKRRGLPARAQNRIGLLAAGTAGLFLFSFAFKLVLNRWPATMPLQFLTQLAIIGFTVGTMVLALLLEEKWTRLCPPQLQKGLTAFAALSLEMYLVQFVVIGWCKALPFPVSVLAALMLSTLLAFLLHAADTLIFRTADAALSHPDRRGNKP